VFPIESSRSGFAAAEERATGATIQSVTMFGTLRVDMGAGLVKAELFHGTLGCSICFFKTHFAPPGPLQ
jgi:hypothetical protein